MRNSAGIVADGDKDQPSRETSRTIRAHFAGDLASIRKGKAAGSVEPSSARTETGTERKQVTPGGRTTQYKPNTAAESRRA